MTELDDEVRDIERVATQIRKRVAPNAILGVSGLRSDLDRLEKLTANVRKMLDGGS